MTHTSKQEYSVPVAEILDTIDSTVLCASLDNVTEEQFEFDWE